eukprot:12934957-Prorocentrum_lima.AAC.1
MLYTRDTLNAGDEIVVHEANHHLYILAHARRAEWALFVDGATCASTAHQPAFSGAAGILWLLTGGAPQ